MKYVHPVSVPHTGHSFNKKHIKSILVPVLCGYRSKAAACTTFQQEFEGFQAIFFLTKQHGLSPNMYNYKVL